VSAADPPLILWFRQDLRLDDNPALNAAAETGRPLICLYILDDKTPGRWRIGGAGRWWLHESLAALDARLRKLGGALVLRRGRAQAVLTELIAETGATGLYGNRTYEPYALARDIEIKAALSERGIEGKGFNGALLFEPWSIVNKSGEPFKVYSAFWRACQAQPPRAPLKTPKRLRFAPVPASDVLQDWRLKPTRPNWAKAFPEHWKPGEAGAHARLDALLDAKLYDYSQARDLLAEDATSRLSPHLHWGEISAQTVWTRVQTRAAEDPRLQHGADKFLSELGWREFSHHLLFHAPNLPERNWRSAFDAFPWRDDAEGFAAWTHGRTGYPIVDAGMRELWSTGYMHNRARMIAASFLIKHLLIDWRAGQDWFWDTLVDADLANNAAAWQWVAGSGADAAPYFRIFNPVLQGEKFDEDGTYVRRWIPELARLATPNIHKPWEAPPLVLRAAGVRLGETYPAPIVDHAPARARALKALASIKSDPDAPT